MKIRCLIALTLSLSLAGVAQAAGDAAKGAIVFKKCQACHTVDVGKNKIGPSLAGVVGRKAASIKDFRYSEAMLAFGAGGKVWDEATLAAYLPAPRDVVAGTSMAFAGLRKPDDVANIIAFLKNPAAAQ
jgi:cytochrome c